MRQIQISKNEAGQRFDKLLFKYLNKSSKGFIYKMLRKKNITLNGKKASGNEQLQIGDEVKIFLSEETIVKFSQVETYDMTDKLDIIYENEDLLVINKPIGVLSQKAKVEDVSINEMALSYLSRTEQITEETLRIFKPSICNRLDRNTSGLIIFGKTLQGTQRMAELLKSRELEKYYLCVVKGCIEQKALIKGYLIKSQDDNKVTIHAESNGNEEYVETEYQPIYTDKEYTVLKVHLITGKTHQIRAHLASQGHPIIGDYKYGTAKVNDYFKKKYGLQSQCLHAYQLAIPPDLRCEAVPPKIFRTIIGDITNGNMEFTRA